MSIDLLQKFPESIDVKLINPKLFIQDETGNNKIDKDNTILTLETMGVP